MRRISPRLKSQRIRKTISEMPLDGEFALAPVAFFLPNGRLKTEDLE